MRIHKYKMEGAVAHGSHGIIRLPKKSRGLSIGIQDSGPVLWALHEFSSSAEDEWKWTMVFTGWTMPADLKDAEFIGTLTFESGIVGHFFIQKI